MEPTTRARPLPAHIASLSGDAARERLAGMLDVLRHPDMAPAAKVIALLVLDDAERQGITVAEWLATDEDAAAPRGRRAG